MQFHLVRTVQLLALAVEQYLSSFDLFVPNEGMRGGGGGEREWGRESEGGGLKKYMAVVRKSVHYSQSRQAESNV